VPTKNAPSRNPSLCAHKLRASLNQLRVIALASAQSAHLRFGLALSRPHSHNHLNDFTFCLPDSIRLQTDLDRRAAFLRAVDGALRSQKIRAILLRPGSDLFWLHPETMTKYLGQLVRQGILELGPVAISTTYRIAAQSRLSVKSRSVTEETRQFRARFDIVPEQFRGPLEIPVGLRSCGSGRRQ